MKAFKLFLWSIITLFSFSACQQTVLPADLVKYVVNPDNGLRKQKSIGDVNVDLQYKPVGYMIANEFRKNNIDASQYKNRASELSGLQYYNLKLSINQPGVDVTSYNVFDEVAQQERLYYLSFGMQHDMHLIQGQDTLRPVLYHFERSYNLSKERTFVVAFEEQDFKHQEDKTFILDIPEFQTGPIKIKIRKDDLQKTPSIKLI